MTQDGVVRPATTQAAPRQLPVKIGVGLANLPFEDARGYWRWIQCCEDSSIDSIWQTDRLVTRTPFLESISTMAALAGATERLKFGMNVTVVSHRDPLVVARQCATIDFLSSGRLLPAFGVGFAEAAEFEATGRSPARRGRRADEALEIITRLWSEESVSFDGEFYQYRDVSIAPRPTQSRLPLWIGGSSSGAIRRTARLGTGWVAGIQSPEQIAPVVQAIAAESAKVGRPIPADHYGAGLAYRFGSWEDPIVEGTVKAYQRIPGDVDVRAHFAIGGEAEIRERIEAYRAVGITKFILRPLAATEAEVMDQTERLIEGVLPAFH